MPQLTDARAGDLEMRRKENYLMNDIKTVVAGNSEFAFDIYAKLKNDPKIKEDGGNLFFSPYSISTALAMTWAGARTETEKQMAQVLHFPLAQSRLHHTFETLAKQLNTSGKKDGYQLSVANALWGQKGYGFLKEFLKITEKKYGARLREVNFAGEAEKTREIINAWVEERTKDKIKEVIKPGVLNRFTRLVLTNAIYFKGGWASEFRKENTKAATFHVTTDKTEEVAMMYQKRNFKYAENDELQILELPYKKDELSMVVLLPKRIDGLRTLEKSLTSYKLDEYMGKLHKREIMVYLPKFKIASEVDLVKTLTAMGMPDAFRTSKADFSGMNGRRDLFISAVLHKAFVEIDEEGTEAAAATGVVVDLIAIRLPVFLADHPFIFVIKDNRYASILFMGRIMNPAKQCGQRNTESL